MKSIHINSQARYSPRTQGAIRNAAYSERARHITRTPEDNHSARQATGPALRQNGELYAFTPIRGIGLNKNWHEMTIDKLVAESFSKVKPSGAVDLSFHPDFSENGDIIEFGFVRQDCRSDTDEGFSTTTAIDDWRIELTIESPMP
jgi:hypothetical protein